MWLELEQLGPISILHVDISKLLKKTFNLLVLNSLPWKMPNYVKLYYIILLRRYENSIYNIMIKNIEFNISSYFHLSSSR